jgi:hypothetical protein
MTQHATTHAQQSSATTTTPIPGGILQRKCACGTHTIAGGACQSCGKEKTSGNLQRAAKSAEPVNEVPPVVHDVLRSTGQPLDAETRSFFEPRFEHDFSHVRVHTDARAAESAQAVNALAYTVGSEVVFGAGQYAPQTDAGRRLLAHELTHVAQQGATAATLQPFISNSPDSADELEAETVSRQIVAGEPFMLPRVVPQSPPLQRKMLNKVETDFQPGAKACLVHLHGEERTAKAVSKELRSRRCVNLVHLDTTQRNVLFEITAAGSTHLCSADPNRVFTDKGRRNDALDVEGCRLAAGADKTRTDIPADTKKPDAVKAAATVKDAAAKELELFVKDQWGKNISLCRGGDGSAVTNGTLPTLAVHNNEVHEKEIDGKKTKVSLLDSYKKAAETNPARLPNDPGRPGQKMPNPSVKAGEGINDFFLMTDPQDFLALSATRTALLQVLPVPPKGQDGSLSVELAGQRFITIEKEGRRHDKVNEDPKTKFKSRDQIYVKNYAMAAEALDVFGVPDGTCQPATTAPVQTPATPNKTSGEGTTTSPSTQPTPATPTTDASVLDRDAPPKTKPKGCELFENQGDLDAQKAVWKQKIGRMPLVEVVNWIIGGPDAIPNGVEQEVQRQRTCMTDAMSQTLTAKGLKLPKGNIIKSEVRRFDYQEKSIWQPKFDFTYGSRFGHISDAARLKCTGLITGIELNWDPTHMSHKHCWTMLTAEEKAKEILMTSSAPGVSRHHAGTDFDFGKTDKDLEPEAWTSAGDFADAYRWLAKNSSRYGFIQPFETKGGYGKGYAAERWHWSYYPIANALLEFAQAHQSDIDRELQEHWAGKPQFDFISKHWRDYLFNVETKARF